ncbi:MAG: hypothetical protein GX287_00700 [Fusobacteria bacterium]|nr:hypothetical protein [Fusobacteriota bacterium]
MAILSNKKGILFTLIFLLSITTFASTNMKQKALQLLRKQYPNQKTYENIVSMYERQYPQFSEYLSEDIYWEGVYTFPRGENIFLTKVYDTKKIEEEIKRVEALIDTIFIELSFIMKDSGNNWSATFYYKEENSGARGNTGNVRKSITNREDNFIANKEAFDLIAGQNNEPTLTIVHRKSGVKKILRQKTGR